MKISHLLFLLLVAFAPIAWADDAVEAAVTGDLVFEKAPEISMVDETLTISKSAGTSFSDSTYSIDVDFHFKNTSDHDVVRKIAFVLPPVQCQMDINSMWTGLENSKNSNGDQNKGLKDFSGTVDGKPLVFTKRTEAMMGGHRMTDLLNKLNVPLNPCQIPVMADGTLNPKYSAALQKYHLIVPDTNTAAWTENIYFEWVQTFPAGTVVHIHHHYTPVIGESVPSPRAVSELNDWFTKNNPPLYPIWNGNPATLAINHPSLVSKNTELSGNEPRICVMPSWVRYHLSTGAYWQGGIGIFKLIINDNSGAPFAVNQFYQQGSPVQTSMTKNSMAFTTQHFVPSQDLLVLFLSLPQTEQDRQACGM
jgi:hypothetical protein